MKAIKSFFIPFLLLSACTAENSVWKGTLNDEEIDVRLSQGELAYGLASFEIIGSASTNISIQSLDQKAYSVANDEFGFFLMEDQNPGFQIISGNDRAEFNVETGSALSELGVPRILTTATGDSLLLWICQPLFPAYGVQSVTFFTGILRNNLLTPDDSWRVNFLPWMNMGDSGHSSQFNEQPMTLGTDSVGFSRGKLSFSMAGDWELRVMLKNAVKMDSASTTFTFDVLDEEELNAVMESITLHRVL